MSLQDLSDLKDLRDAASAAVLNQEREIAADHRADRENGLSEAQANESDAFERRVLGLPDDNQHSRYGAAGYSGCYD